MLHKTIIHEKRTSLSNYHATKEKETVWRLKISVLIDTNLWIDWDFYQFCKFSHHWIKSLRWASGWLMPACTHWFSCRFCILQIGWRDSSMNLTGFWWLKREPGWCQNCAQSNIRSWPGSQQTGGEELIRREKWSEELLRARTQVWPDQRHRQ